jgi:hypothetical protein
MKSRLALAAVLLTVTACAGVPTGPSVMVLAGKGKTLEQFQTDDGVCRQVAAQEIQKTKRSDIPAQRRYDMAYMQCMYAKGHDIRVPGVASELPSSTSASGVPPGTPTAAPVTWPPTRAQIDCEASGGVWRAALDFCEFPSPEIPLRRRNR